MEITEGKRYRTLSGRITGPLHRQHDTTYPWIDHKFDGTYDTWTFDGHALATKEPCWHDIVEEYTED